MPNTAAQDLADADTRTQDLASTIALMYADGRIDSDTLHELISGLTLIRSSIRFASRGTL